MVNCKVDNDECSCCVMAEKCPVLEKYKEEHKEQIAKADKCKLLAENLNIFVHELYRSETSLTSFDEEEVKAGEERMERVLKKLKEVLSEL